MSSVLMAWCFLLAILLFGVLVTSQITSYPWTGFRQKDSASRYETVFLGFAEAVLATLWVLLMFAVLRLFARQCSLVLDYFR